MDDTYSLHYAEQRQDRESFIDGHLGDGNIVESFTVNRGHPKGSETHSVTDTGIIIVRNTLTGKLITKLIARPEQLRRLYTSKGLKPPAALLRLAYKNNSKHFNNM